jgi:pyrimidine-nucleoside phosphorylase
MRAYDILAKKRDGKRLDFEEFNFMVQNFVEGKIPDYQMSAFLMAAYINGLDKKELIDLTRSMITSGECLDLSQIPGIKVDKHSTGGVGDKTTLVLAPLVTSLGVPVAKMSGRGLGHTGGTLDKLESIPGFNVNFSSLQFIEQVKEIGIAVISASEKIVPADKKIYALRDVTATVSSIPLIASSIVSKKIAGGADSIVFDVKSGSGAFLKNLGDSRKLGKLMVDMVKAIGRSSVAIISNMDQPLGYTIGNALEVAEAIDTLKGEGPSDLEELCLILGAYMLILGQKASSLKEGKSLLKEAILSGKALAKFEEFVVAQGGDPSCIESPRILPRAQFVSEFRAVESGYVAAIDAEKIGYVAMELGAGRLTKESKIDLSAGLILFHKVGDYVTKGDKLAEIHTNKAGNLAEIEVLLKQAFLFHSKELEPQPLIYDTIGEI